MIPPTLSTVWANVLRPNPFPVRGQAAAWRSLSTAWRFAYKVLITDATRMHGPLVPADAHGYYFRFCAACLDPDYRCGVPNVVVFCHGFGNVNCYFCIITMLQRLPK